MIACIRSEIESNLTAKEREELIKGLFSLDCQVVLFDTEVKRDVYEEMRELEVSSMIAFFGMASCVVTDRMHGMVFAAITGTPCVVIKSRDNKIKGTYEWISHLKYIKLCEENKFDMVLLAIKEAKDLKDLNNNYVVCGDYEKEIKKDIYDLIIKRRNERLMS